MPTRMLEMPEIPKDVSDTPMTFKLAWGLFGVFTVLGALLLGVAGWAWRLESRVSLNETTRDINIKNRDKEISEINIKITNLEERQRVSDLNYNELNNKMTRALTILERLDPKK